MKLPRHLLRDSVAVASYGGQSALGPVLSGSVDVPCKVSWTRQLVRGIDGEEVVSELTLYVHPADAAPFAPGASVTIHGYESRVISVSPQARPGETVLVRVTCR